MKASAKKNYIQITEARYSKMDDATFVKTFEEEHSPEIRELETPVFPKLIPFFEAILTKKEFAEFHDEFEMECAQLQIVLDQYPKLISRLPLQELLRMEPEERLMLLVRHPEEAEILKQTLEGNDIWALYLPMWRVQLQRERAKICPWETLTASQKRYMSLKSATLKKSIEKQQTPKK